MDLAYCPLVVIEVNDQSHLSPERRQRDKRVENICEEAGIAFITLWTSYGINPEYIKKRIEEALSSFPRPRVHHFEVQQARPSDAVPQITPPPSTSPCINPPKKKKGCYIATCVYGSYDCPPVWTLRRFRDGILNQHWYGRIFVSLYYRFSPFCVRLLGNNVYFRFFCKLFLDVVVKKLQKSGFQSTPYQD